MIPIADRTALCLIFVSLWNSAFSSPIPPALCHCLVRKGCRSRWMKRHFRIVSSRLIEFSDKSQWRSELNPLPSQMTIHFWRLTFKHTGAQHFGKERLLLEASRRFALAPVGLAVSCDIISA